MIFVDVIVLCGYVNLIEMPQRNPKVLLGGVFFMYNKTTAKNNLKWSTTKTTSQILTKQS